MAIKIYDNGGKTADRYTAINTNRRVRGQFGMYEAIGFNAYPFHPQGYGQHTIAEPGRHLGKRVKLDELPADAARFVCSFAKE